MSGVRDRSVPVTLPSLFVSPFHTKLPALWVLGGLCSVNETGMFAAGLPIVVSRTWHVIGGFFSAIVEDAGLESWFDSARMRSVVWFAGLPVEEVMYGG
jgi:hypothetical protein